ncbi:MAG: 16S rRNA (guanine(527)-N(7))-methyltransferase RsmG [Planctomycetota bacterium]
MTSPPAAAAQEIDRLGISLDRDAVDRLDRYLALLLEANEKVNLTAVRDRDPAWSRLIVDSLTVVPFLDEQAGDGLSMIDVGTGGGLPGLPVAIARPGWSVTLLDATGKKVEAVRGFVEALGLENVRVVQGRAEAVGHEGDHRERYDVAVCRGVGVMAELLEYTLPMVRVGGAVLAMKGPKVKDELAAAGDALAELGGGELAVYDAYPEGFDNELVMVWVSKSERTPEAYPRLPGVPKREPIGLEPKPSRPAGKKQPPRRRRASGG